MRTIKTIIIILFSTGWMIPFSWSIWITHEYIKKVVWPQARWGTPYDYPFHFFDIAHYVFFVSMIWLFTVILYWLMRSIYSE